MTSSPTDLLLSAFHRGNPTRSICGCSTPWKSRSSRKKVLNAAAHCRARLIAIADVRDGLSSKLLPRSPMFARGHRWIKRGALGGLEAALERPSGQLSRSQATELIGSQQRRPTYRAGGQIACKTKHCVVSRSRHDPCLGSAVAHPQFAEAPQNFPEKKTHHCAGLRSRGQHNLGSRSLIFVPSPRIWGKPTAVILGGEKRAVR
jgi:hypothetical protein